MQIGRLIASVKLNRLAAASGIPLATLWRWRENNAIPGHPPVRALQLQRIRDAVRKVKLDEAEEMDRKIARNRAVLESLGRTPKVRAGL